MRVYKVDDKGINLVEVSETEMATSDEALFENFTSAMIFAYEALSDRVKVLEDKRYDASKDRPDCF